MGELIFLLLSGLVIVVLLLSRREHHRETEHHSQNRYIGKQGENLVHDTLEEMFAKHQDWHIISDITLPLGKGTTQIDHVLVSCCGIFVIETKHISGWIFGQPWQKQWTQVLFKQKNRFTNPIHQNAVHLNALRRLLPVPHRCYISVIVFSADSVFKTDMPENVIYLEDLVEFIDARDRQLLWPEQTIQVKSLIEAARLPPGAATDNLHINYVTSKR